MRFSFFHALALSLVASCMPVKGKLTDDAALKQSSASVVIAVTPANQNNVPATNGVIPSYACGATVFSVIAQYYGKVPDATANVVEIFTKVMTNGLNDPGKIMKVADGMGLNYVYSDWNSAVMKAILQPEALYGYFQKNQLIYLSVKGWRGFTAGHLVLLHGVSEAGVHIMDPWDGGLVTKTFEEIHAFSDNKYAIIFSNDGTAPVLPNGMAGGGGVGGGASSNALCPKTWCLEEGNDKKKLEGKLGEFQSKRYCAGGDPVNCRFGCYSNPGSLDICANSPDDIPEFATDMPSDLIAFRPKGGFNPLEPSAQPSAQSAPTADLPGGQVPGPGNDDWKNLCPQYAASARCQDTTGIHSCSNAGGQGKWDRLPTKILVICKNGAPHWEICEQGCQTTETDDVCRDGKVSGSCP